jgi:hypothetical protein
MGHFVVYVVAVNISNENINTITNSIEALVRRLI